MEHGSPFGHARLPSPWFWLAVALAIATIVLGTWAHMHHAPAGLHMPAPAGGTPPADWISAFYHSVQLLVLHSPHVDGVGPLLHVARWLGVAFFFLAGALAFAKLFRNEALLLQLRMPWRRSHVVVCGLGDLGLRLALDGRARGRFVVAIEQRGALPAVELAREHGVLVLEDDACDPAVLRKARVARAELLVAACDADHTNVAVAAAVAPLLAGADRRRTPLVCRLLIRDGATRAMLAAHPFFPHAAGGYRVNVSDLDYCDTAARQALRRHPLDHRPVRADDATVVRLAIVGCGPMGRGLARHAARVGHFANEAARGVRLAITMLDHARGPGWSEFQAPLAAVCAVEFQAIDPDSPELVERLAALADADSLLTCATCVETRREVGPDDATNFRIGVELARRLAGRPAQVLTFQRTSAGFAALLSAERRADPALDLHPFGMVEGVYDWDVLLHESEDALARALHEDFVRQRARTGAPVPPSWDELTDSLKDSNRQAADHVAIKLRAVGYHVRPLEPGRPRVERFTDAETLLMAKMEHLRWCAERTLDGWAVGAPADADRRINPNLVPWEQLDAVERQKDPEQVLAIPGALYRLGRGIYR